MNFVCILTENNCYKNGCTIKPKGVMVHSTGANNPTIRRYVQPSKSNPEYDALLAYIGKNQYNNDWNRSGLDVCVHAFIGKLSAGTVDAVQTLPWVYRGWHAGRGPSGKSANDTHISFEICEDGLDDPVYFKQVYDKAVELTAELCEMFDLEPLEDGVVICHSEGYKRGIASNHGDVMHWFPKHGKDMDDFRIDVANKIREKHTPVESTLTESPRIVYPTLEDVPAYYKPTIEKLIKLGALQGTGKEDVLNVSYDFCRVMTVLDRLGKFE